MEIDAIASITRRIADDNGWDGFLPTLIDPDSRTVLVLEGIPVGIEHKKAAVDWMQSKSSSQAVVFLAYKVIGGIEISRCQNGSLTGISLLIKQSNK
jgi:hypothetical protein